MEDEIKDLLDEFHKSNEEARNHFDALKYIPGEPFNSDIRKSLLLYNKWRTKADVALNSYNSILTRLNPSKLPWTAEQLRQEHEDLQQKLIRIEEMLLK